MAADENKSKATTNTHTHTHTHKTGKKKKTGKITTLALRMQHRACTAKHKRQVVNPKGGKKTCASQKATIREKHLEMGCIA